MADRILLERIMEEEGAWVDPAEPSLTTWLGAIFTEWWDGLMDGIRIDGATGPWVLWFVGALGVVLVVLLAVIAVRSFAPRTRELPAVPTNVPEASSGDLAEILGLLEAGRLREAAQAAWVWMAEGLAAKGVGRVHPDQTHGEFFGTVPSQWPARSTLRELRDAADALCYAPAEPTRDAVRAWLDRAERLRTAP